MEISNTHIRDGSPRTNFRNIAILHRLCQCALYCDFANIRALLHNFLLCDFPDRNISLTVTAKILCVFILYDKTPKN